MKESLGGISMDINAFNKVSYGVYIATAKYGEEVSGCVITTLMQITAEETPKMTVAINKSNYTNELIKKAKKVNVSVLSEEADMLLIGKFGFRSGRDFNKLDGTEFLTGENGIPVVTQNATSYFEADVIEEIDAGTHTIFLLNIADAVILNDKNPMTYDYYHKVVKGKTPKTAATFSN